jgi:hypothetical protein
VRLPLLLLEGKGFPHIITYPDYSTATTSSTKNESYMLQIFEEGVIHHRAIRILEFLWGFDDYCGLSIQ